MFLAGCLALILQLPDPRAAVRAARRAVEGDSAAASAARSSQLGLATIARLTYHYEEAERLYAAIGGVYADLGRGWAGVDRDFVPVAESAFVRADRETHDPLAKAEALIGLTMLRAATGGIPVGFTLLDSAERLLPRDELELRAEIAFRRATLAAIVSRADTRRLIQQAVQLAREAHLPRAEARAWRALALVYKIGAQSDSNEIVLRRVEEMQRAAHDRSELGVTLIRHAEIYHENGDMGAFRRWAMAAHAEGLASGNGLVIAGAVGILGTVALALNDYPSAAAYLDQALATYRAIGDSGNVHAILAYEGDLATATGDLARARAIYEGEAAFNKTVGDTSQVFDFERGLASIDLRAGDRARATRDLDSAVAVARANHHSEWIAGLDRERALIALADSQPVRAAVLLDRYIATRDTTEHMMRYEGRVLRAEAYAEGQRLRDAERELAAAEDEIDAWRARLTDRDMRVLVFQAGPQEVNDRDMHIATVIHALALGGFASDAFSLAERRRARDLADHLAQLSALSSGTAVASPSVARVTSTEVERGLDSSTALIEFVTGARGAPTTVFAVTRDTLRAYGAPGGDSLAGPIARFVALLEAGQDPGVLARTLGTALLKTEATQIIIVPDGPLHRLPFDALIGPDDRALVEHSAISIVPSAAVWLALRARHETPRVPRILAFGDPAFARASRPSESGGESGAAEYRSAVSTTDLPRLPESGREAQMVASFARLATVRLGDSASAAYLKHAALDSFTVLHFATHAIVDDRSADRTALMLSPSAGESGVVTPSDVAGLRLHADLIVLSACRSAGGVVVDGEGVQGLTAPFLEAGARSVIATEWRIKDETTVAFVQAFYAALARGLPVAEALRAAKLERRASGARPGEWAAFTVVGDPTVRVAVLTPRPFHVSTSLVILSVAIVLGLCMRARAARRV
ncbi:MAG TPA: CHAT domain-containing protein [Gemmatimonadaceae bacterium]|nr:CHAT domain-containing protein [Gemmatimonadaceae bacterium]